MGKFIQFIQEEERKKYQWLTFEIDTYVVHILFETTLNESKLHGFPLGGQYSAQLHNAHSEVGQKHLHVYAKNNQIFSMNIDGTAHDKSHRTRIPNKVANAILLKFSKTSQEVRVTIYTKTSMVINAQHIIEINKQLSFK